MKEALHPVSLDGAVEKDTPSDFHPVVADDPSATPPLVYTIPAASLALAACGGGGGGSPTAATPPPPSVQVAKPTTDAEAARFILKSSLSVTDAEISNIRSIGYEPWLNAQMDVPISQTGVAWLSSRGYDQVTADNFFDKHYVVARRADNVCRRHVVAARPEIRAHSFFLQSLCFGEKSSHRFHRRVNAEQTDDRRSPAAPAYLRAEQQRCAGGYSQRRQLQNSGCRRERQVA